MGGCGQLRAKIQNILPNIMDIASLNVPTTITTKINAPTSRPAGAHIDDLGSIPPPPPAVFLESTLAPYRRLAPPHHSRQILHVLSGTASPCFQPSCAPSLNHRASSANKSEVMTSSKCTTRRRNFAAHRGLVSEGSAGCGLHAPTNMPRQTCHFTGQRTTPSKGKGAEIYSRFMAEQQMRSPEVQRSLRRAKQAPAADAAGKRKSLNGRRGTTVDMQNAR